MAVRGRIWPLAYCLIGASVPLAAARQPVVQPPTPEVLEQAVKDMASDDVVLRMDAQRRVSEGVSFRLRDVETVLKSGKLTPEQRLRLEVVAYRRFCNEPRAALGVQSSFQDLGQRGVLLSMVMPGFPASETLRPGDRILVVDGQAITDISLMRPVVIAHDPGDEVPVVLIRDGANVTLKVKLGKYSDLSRDARGGSQAMTPDMLEGAWEFRAMTYQKAGASDAKPIESGISAADRNPQAGVDLIDDADGTDPRQWGAARRRLAELDPKDSECVAAGEARGGNGIVVRLTGQPGVGGGNFRLVPGDGQVLLGPRIQLNDAGRPADRQAELAQIRLRQETLRSIMSRNINMMRTLPDAQRAPLIQQNALLQQEIDELERLAVQPAPQPRIVKP